MQFSYLQQREVGTLYPCCAGFVLGSIKYIHVSGGNYVQKDGIKRCKVFSTSLARQDIFLFSYCFFFSFRKNKDEAINDEHAA